jgi:hypothetical protein
VACPLLHVVVFLVSSLEPMSEWQSFSRHARLLYRVPLSDAIFSRLGSAASGETIFGANSLGDVAQRSTFDRREELHADGIITIPPPSVHTDSALKAEDEV